MEIGLSLFIDGNNLLYALGMGRGNDSPAAEQLLQRLEICAAEKGWEVVVVFDGQERFLRRESGLLVIRYAGGGKTADTVIERLVYQAPDRSGVVVVTQDRAESDLILGLGGQVWSVRRLLEELENAVK